MQDDDQSDALRLDRLLSMLRRLSGVQGATAQALAAEHGVTTRTVQRDLSFLRESNFPIESLGRGLGYRLDPQFGLPAQALSTPEVLPMVLGGQLFGLASQREALSKLRNYVVNGVEKLLTSEMEGKVKQPGQAAQGLEWLELVSLAIVQKRSAKLLYASSEGLPRWRWVDPHTLFLRNAVWYVEAFDLEKREARTFRLSRIQQFETLGLGQVGEYQSTEGFHPWDFGKQAPVEARLRLTPRLSAWLLENPVHPSQWLRGDKVVYEVKDRQAFIRWFMGLDGATLLGDTELLMVLGKQVKAVSDRHKLPR